MQEKKPKLEELEPIKTPVADDEEEEVDESEALALAALLKVNQRIDERLKAFIATENKTQLTKLTQRLLEDYQLSFYCVSSVMRLRAVAAQEAQFRKEDEIANTLRKVDMGDFVKGDPRLN